MSKFHIDDFVQLPAGTHGLRATGEGTSTLLGKLIVTPQHEIWLWAGAAFPDTFYLHFTGAPTTGLLGASVFEYVDATFPGTPTNPNLTSLKVWVLSVGTSPIGMLGKRPDDRLCWVTNHPTAPRFELSLGTILKFSLAPAITEFEQDFNHISVPRMVPPPQP